MAGLFHVVAVLVMQWRSDAFSHYPHEEDIAPHGYRSSSVFAAARMRGGRRSFAVSWLGASDRDGEAVVPPRPMSTVFNLGRLAMNN